MTTSERLLSCACRAQRPENPLLDLRVAARRPVLLTDLASIAMGFARFTSNVAYPQMLELPLATGVGLGLSLLAASVFVMPSELVMMVLSPISGTLARTSGPRVLLIAGSIPLILVQGFSLLFSTEVWRFVVANTLIGFGIGFGYASMPMLIMRAVPPNETAASNGLNALARSIGTSTAAAIVGAVLATLSTGNDDARVPTAQAFPVSFLLGIGAAATALVLALLIPARETPPRGGTGHRCPSGLSNPAVTPRVT